MLPRPRLLVLLAVSALLLPRLALAAAPEHKLSTSGEPPQGLSKAVAMQLDPKGVRIAGPDGPVCEIWFVKSLTVKPGFKSTLEVKYPLEPGSLVGALRVPEGSTYHDFRTQEIGSGVYTLRYGQQPVDGNHIGTSAVADFLLAVPAEKDEDPKAISDFDTLAGMSAAAVGSSHPAILSLQPPSDVEAAPSLTRDDSRDFVFLNAVGTGKAGDETTKVRFKLVAIGHAQE